MLVFSFIYLLLISARFTQSDRFVTNQEIDLGSTISIDASVAQKNDIVFYNEYSMDPYTAKTINIYNFTNFNYGFGILQVHSCWYNLTLSYNKTIQSNYHENGTDLGFNLYPSLNSPQQVFLYNYNYYTSVNISIAFIPYNKSTPEPGGCNLEYSVSVAPVLIVKMGNELLRVDSPLAADRADEFNEVKRCNASLTYTSYYMYLQRGDDTCRSLFDGVRSLMTIQGSNENGYLAAAVPRGLINRMIYTAIPGTGIVFQTIVSGKGGTSAYIPAFTMSCSPTLWETSCNIFASPTYNLLAGILIFVGVIRAYFGEVLITIGVFIDAFVVGVFLNFYIFHSSEGIISEEKANNILFIGGLFVATFLTILYMCYSTLQTSIELLSNIIVGYLMGAFTVYIADDILYDLKNVPWMYETFFIGWIFAIIFVLPPSQSHSRIILRATWGSFCIIQGLCYTYGNNLNYVILNTIRYTSLPEFKQAHSTPSINTEDIWFLVLWVFFTSSAIVFQLELKKHRENLNGERAPLISRMTTGSDEVFESPTSSIRSHQLQLLERLKLQLLHP